MSSEQGSAELRRTPLYARHKQYGARFTAFAGWEMPVQYSGLVDEHIAVRENAGVFDVSHMGEVAVRGPNALDFLQYVTSNDVSNLEPGRAQYTLLLNDQGGVVDDIIVYMLSDDEYLLCVNAGNAEKDWEWIKQHNSHKADLANVSSTYAQLAVQGPKSRVVLCAALSVPKEDFSPADFRTFDVHPFSAELGKGGVCELLIACTGYTGEDGFEIFCPSDRGEDLWNTVMEAGKPLGLKPAGLGARDTLRLEACFPLHGHELREDVPAFSSGVGWAVKVNKGDFIGREALLKVKEDGLKQKLVGFEVVGPGIVRADAPIVDPGGNIIGHITSGTKPPTVNKAVALGFVSLEFSAPGTELEAEVRGKRLKIRIIRRPFYKRT